MQKHPGENESWFAVERSSNGDGKVHVTPAERALQDQLTAAVARFAETRSVIEQAKGMLMVVYGIDAPTAFEMLKWRSQHTNVKLRLVAEQIAAGFIELRQRETNPPRSAYDNIVLTAHLWIDAENQLRDAAVLAPTAGTG
jgi:hypothetical protein